MMLYFLFIFAVLLVAFLSLRLRMRFSWGDDKRLLFVGLGRSGSEIDFVDNEGAVRVFGWRVKTFRFAAKSDKKKSAKEKPKKEKQKEERQRDWVSILPRIIPKTTTALGRMVANLYKHLIIEELDARIEAGFDSPHLTGQAYGCYHAVVAAVPGLSQRICFQPNWVEASFRGQAHIAFALPLYRLLWRLLLLLGQLPLRELYKLAIGTKRGGQDVQ